MKLLKNDTIFTIMIVSAFLVGGIASNSILHCLLFNTEYSENFSKSVWSKVEIGMSESQVKSMLGEPLYEYRWPDEDKVTLHYSKSGSNNGSYVHYYLVIQDGKVLIKRKKYFVD